MAETCQPCTVQHNMKIATLKLCSGEFVHCNKLDCFTAMMKTGDVSHDSACFCFTGEIQRLVAHDTDVLQSAWLEFAVAASPVSLHQLKTGGCLYRVYAIFRVSCLTVLKGTLTLSGTKASYER